MRLVFNTYITELFAIDQSSNATVVEEPVEQHDLSGYAVRSPNYWHNDRDVKVSHPDVDGHEFGEFGSFFFDATGCCVDGVDACEYAMPITAAPAPVNTEPAPAEPTLPARVIVGQDGNIRKRPRRYANHKRMKHDAGVRRHQQWCERSRFDHLSVVA